LLGSIDIEKEFDKCIGNIGGQRVDDLLDKSPSIKNADYIFDKYKIVAELKCLQDNKLKDKELNKKLSKLHSKWSSQGYRVPIQNHGSHMSMTNLSQSQSREVLNVYSKPVKKRINKANTQIKQTKREFKKDDYKGILLLANDGNLALDPEHIYHIISNSMRESFSAIDAVIFFTVNQPGKATFTNLDTLVWSNLNRPNREPISNEFYNSLYSAWSAHLESILNTCIPAVKLSNESDLSRIKNKHNP
jgi:hypothetical protein